MQYRANKVPRADIECGRVVPPFAFDAPASAVSEFWTLALAGASRAGISRGSRFVGSTGRSKPHANSSVCPVHIGCTRTRGIQSFQLNYNEELALRSLREHNARQSLTNGCVQYAHSVRCRQRS